MILTYHKSYGRRSRWLERGLLWNMRKIAYSNIFLLFVTLLLLTGGLLLPDQTVSAATYEDFTQITWTRVADQPFKNAEG
ncbi:MAG TPA: hypothetical protein VHL11_08560, partial [Phototrophicaceae bacterium]|nr:hypothetical protein [Phototrophicaceae bacterium]